MRSMGSILKQTLSEPMTGSHNSPPHIGHSIVFCLSASVRFRLLVYPQEQFHVNCP